MSLLELAKITDGARLYSLFQSAPDPLEFQMQLSREQQHALEREIERARTSEQNDFNDSLAQGILLFHNPSCTL